MPHRSGSSGEFHSFRLPVPSLWLDILQKAKAAGLNAVSVYSHWGLLNPAPGVVDFDFFRALQPLFDAALTAGIWIILRPGPYINAETTAGGIAHWVTSQTKGTLRTNATDFHDTWQDYIQGIIAQTVPNQITEGGPVIGKFQVTFLCWRPPCERPLLVKVSKLVCSAFRARRSHMQIQVSSDNEYFQSGFGNAQYFSELEAAYHNSSIVVPLTYNDPGQERNFVNGTVRFDSFSHL